MKPTYEELQAQVEVLRQALWDQLNDCINFDGGKLTDCIMENSTTVLQATPAACLAQVKADAVRDFVNYVIDNDLSNTLEAAAFQFSFIKQGDKE